MRRGRDTARVSRENVEAFKRAAEAANRGDIEALLAELDPEVEWHSALVASVAGEAGVYRGHEGVREWRRGQEEAFAEIHAEFSKIRDLGDRLVATGRLRTRGKESGADTESPVVWVVEFKDHKVIYARPYLDPKQGLEAAGLAE